MNHLIKSSLTSLTKQGCVVHCVPYEVWSFVKTKVMHRKLWLRHRAMTALSVHIARGQFFDNSKKSKASLYYVGLTFPHLVMKTHSDPNS